MRTPYTLSVCLVAIRFELADIQYSISRFGCTNEELAKLTEAIEHIKLAEVCLKNYRFIKKVEDMPEVSSKSTKSAKK